MLVVPFEAKGDVAAQPGRERGGERPADGQIPPSLPNKFTNVPNRSISQSQRCLTDSRQARHRCGLARASTITGKPPEPPKRLLPTFTTKGRQAVAHARTIHTSDKAQATASLLEAVVLAIKEVVLRQMIESANT